jgi:quinol monooxygenase YgiN
VAELQVIARYTIAAGEQDTVLALLRKLADATRAEPGNIAFVIYREIDDSRDVVLLERYASPAAFATHRETAHFTDIVLGQIAPRLDSRIIETYNVSG